MGPNAGNGAQTDLDAISTALGAIRRINAGLTRKIGITPMIGVNDGRAEVFSPADAQAGGVRGWQAAACLPGDVVDGA